MTTPVFRFAPSPNGRLHLGHAYSCLLNRQLADRMGGRMLLRIEDIDPLRSRRDLVDGVMDDLNWLGIGWDGPVRRQSEHMADYHGAASALRARGLLYPCFCTRGEIRTRVDELERDRGEAWPRDPDGAPLYPWTCRALSPAAVAALTNAGRQPAWRLAGAEAAILAGSPLRWIRFVGSAGASDESVVADPGRWGDPILVRRDTPTSYHLACVTDDAAQGVTHVVRGRDLEAATDLHVLLQRLLDLPSPRYLHHRLLQGEDGDKLSKSAGSPSLAALRQSGRSAAAIRQELGFG